MRNANFSGAQTISASNPDNALSTDQNAADSLTCGEFRRNECLTAGRFHSRRWPGSRKIWLAMCGFAPGPMRQKICSTHGRTVGCTENFSSTDLSNSASNLMLQTSQCAALASCASEVMRPGGAVRQFGQSTSQLKFNSPARVACRNNFKTSHRSASHFRATVNGRMRHNSTSDDSARNSRSLLTNGKFFPCSFFMPSPSAAGSVAVTGRFDIAVRCCPERNLPTSETSTRMSRMVFGPRIFRARNFPNALRGVKCAKISTAQPAEVSFRRIPVRLSANGPEEKMRRTW